MEAKVVIENGRTNIVLTPENDFETDLIETVYHNDSKYTCSTSVGAKYGYGSYSNHSINIEIEKKPGK